MEIIKRINPLVALGVGLVLGLLLGMALFWGPFAVKWTDARPYDLTLDSQADYVALVADSFRLDPDRLQAEAFLESWTSEEMVAAIRAAKEKYPDRIEALDDLALVLGAIEVPSAPSAPDEQPSGLVDRLRVPCLVFFGVLLVLVLGWMGLRRLSKRRAETPEKPVIASESADELGRDEPLAALWDEQSLTTLEVFSTTYKLGEDTYDESFSIETPMGEFLGECGVGISEVIGTDMPDKVTAFEVWLFDKSDIRTVTKVLMSEHAFENGALRDRLASKGEAVLAQPATEFTLETSGLEVQVSVAELEYGEGDPVNGHFATLTLELLATVKPAASDASPFEETA